MIAPEPTFGERWDVFCAMPRQPRAILDIGCGTGLGFQSFRRRGSRVVGVDIDPAELEQAAGRLDDAILMDVESDMWPAHFARSFDVVAFCDCLEHLVDPWTVLRSVPSLLTDEGVVVASIPNIRQIRLIAKLLIGRWDYVNGAGTIQRGHVRFFTRETIVDMFEESGFERPKFFFPRDTFHLRKPERLLDVLTRGTITDLLFGSYTVAARPRSGGGR
jgi:2-polyprenyl-3-methyl-5-hydroxy-6-metoxy-1,4-benzoquinol methylase